MVMVMMLMVVMVMVMIMIVVMMVMAMMVMMIVVMRLALTKPFTLLASLHLLILPTILYKKITTNHQQKEHWMHEKLDAKRGTRCCTDSDADFIQSHFWAMVVNNSLY